MPYFKLSGLDITIIVLPCSITFSFLRINLLIVYDIIKISIYYLEEVIVSYDGALSILLGVLDTLVVGGGDYLKFMHPWSTDEGVVSSVCINYVKRCSIFYMAKLCP